MRSTKSSHESRRRRVASLGGGGAQVMSLQVGIVRAQEVGHVDDGPAALAKLATSEIEVFLVTRDKTPSL
jgi:hypothetical protein